MTLLDCDGGAALESKRTTTTGVLTRGSRVCCKGEVLAMAVKECAKYGMCVRGTSREGPRNERKAQGFSRSASTFFMREAHKQRYRFGR